MGLAFRSWLLRRLSYNTAMCAIGIDRLRQHPAKILLLWGNGEQLALGGHLPVKSLDIGEKSTNSTSLCSGCDAARIASGANPSKSVAEPNYGVSHLRTTPRRERLANPRVQVRADT